MAVMSCPVMSMELPKEAPHVKCLTNGVSGICLAKSAVVSAVDPEVLCVSVVVLITTVVTLSRAGDAKYPNSSDDVMKIVLANPVIVILIFAVRDMPTCRGNLL